MNKKRLGISSVLVLAGAMAIAGCSSTTSSTSDVPSAQGESATPSVESSQACKVAVIDGQSKNKELQALATVQLESLDCAGDLNAQAIALAADPALKKKAEAVGATLNTGGAAGTVSLSFVDVKARTSCMITVMDSMKAKQMFCGDL